METLESEEEKRLVKQMTVEIETDRNTRADITVS
jgi:hypothetical protein